jgi:nitrite reductase/ring-hydroxylating ferredoxin subunit
MTEQTLSHAPSLLRLAGAAQLTEGHTRTFAFMRRGYAVEGLLLHHAKGWFAYLNQCQHWPIPLDFGDGEFFDAGLDRIRCRTHGATYEPDSGLCDAGPCARARLTAYVVRLEGEDVLIELTDA